MEIEMNDNKLLVEPPSHRLPLTTWLALVGLLSGFAFLGLGIYLQTNATVLFFALLLIHLGTAILIATFVGLSIDRLFHHEHLDALSTSMNQSLSSHEVRTKDAITKAIRESASGYELAQLSSSNAIYSEIITNMEKYSHFSNTLISDKIIPPTPDRIKYYEKKIELINDGNLTCREIMSETLMPIMSKYLSSIKQEKINKIAVGIVKAALNLPDPLNFCIFHKGLDDFKGGLLMVGWVSDPKNLLVEHTCIKTDHPDLLNLFADYFKVLERAADPYDFKKAI